MITLGSMLKHVIPSAIVRQKLDTRGCILLTFDDGPHPEITPRVLDLLDKYGARGLFFIPGNRILKAPTLVGEIVRRGHGIGNHGFTHAACSQLSFKEIVDEITECKNALLSQSGVITHLYRPPKGIVSPSLVLAARQCKHDIVRWSLDSGEYSYMRNASSSILAANVVQRIRDRAIVLSHDDNAEIPAFLELVLPRLVEDGFDLRSGLNSLGWNGSGILPAIKTAFL